MSLAKASAMLCKLQVFFEENDAQNEVLRKKGGKNENRI